MAARAPRASDPFFEVGKTKFPLISSDRFKKADVRLIEAVTGKDWEKWCDLLAKKGLMQEHVLTGFFAVAVQRARNFTHDEVQAFIDDLPLVDGVKLRFPELEKKAKDGEAGDPPAEGETAAT
jgi:hypothetical protein